MGLALKGLIVYVDFLHCNGKLAMWKKDQTSFSFDAKRLEWAQSVLILYFDGVVNSQWNLRLMPFLGKK